MSAPLVFDRSLVRLRRQRARRLGPVTFLIDRIADEIAERLSSVLRQFALAVDLGSPGEVVRRVLRAQPGIATVIAFAPFAAELAEYEGPKIVGDEEALPFAEGTLDLVVSALTLQSVNDLPGVLVQVRRALKPDGLFLAALLGGDTLNELRQSFAAAEAEVEGGVSPHVAPFADVRDMGALLQRAGFALPVTDIEHLTVRYPSPFELMHDLRGMGAGNALAARRRTPMRRATMMRTVEIYADRFADGDGKVRAAFDIVWLSGWAPDASQQQPLRPGSARMRLADALGTTEISADDKAGR